MKPESGSLLWPIVPGQLVSQRRIETVESEAEIWNEKIGALQGIHIFMYYIAKGIKRLF